MFQEIKLSEALLRYLGLWISSFLLCSYRGSIAEEGLMSFMLNLWEKDGLAG